MLVFGTKNKTTKRGSGTFYCPQCKKDCRYKRYEVSKKGHVFFVSVLDRGTVGEHVQCRKCGGQFDPAVLAMPTRQAVEKDLNMAIRGCIAVMVGADGKFSDAAIEAARRLNVELIGSEMPEEMQRRDVDRADIEDLQTMLIYFSEKISEKGKVQILAACAEVALADGGISKMEMYLLRRMAVPLGVPVEYLPGIIESVPRQR